MSTHRTGVTLALLAFLLTGCDAPGGPASSTPSASPSTDSTDSTDSTGAPATTSPEETPTTSAPGEPTPPVTFGAGDTFDMTTFAGLPVGTTVADFAAASGWTQDGCSAPGNVFFTPASQVGDAAWVLYTPAYDNEPDPDADPHTWGIDEFALALWGPPVPGRVGPVGPNGLQLGASAADVAAAFPDAERREWAVEVTGVVYDQHIVPAPDGTSMVIGLVDGVVADVRWGSSRFADGFAELYCF